jgi:hypothetical protein
MKIIEYKTTSGRTGEQLDREVNRLLQEGYQPYDGPYLVAAKDVPGVAFICQAMMKSFRAATTKAKAGIRLSPPSGQDRDECSFTFPDNNPARPGSILKWLAFS